MSKRILVTGASKGIGRAVAVEAALSGFDVSVHYNKDKDGALETAKLIEDAGRLASILSFNISDREACSKAIEAEIEQYGAYYGVVCNAGITKDNAFPSISGDDWDAVIHTNLDGFYNVIHPIVMPMVRARSGGRIIAMSSVSGIIGNRGQANYSASKAGIIGAAKALAVELGKRKITVNCIAPGVIDTDMANDVPWDYIKDSIPLRRMGKPEEVGKLAAFLLSENASYITRQVISINGGMV
ncbi:MAG: 3-oxoacyl-ACP reductase FabG [Spirochaetales bacterium]|nr:3-oxoacyl-ACP reductase FabG [Spirochaetales bacterium]